jgi:hypothetical protein
MPEDFMKLNQRIIIESDILELDDLNSAERLHVSPTKVLVLSVLMDRAASSLNLKYCA